jgi:enoyl-CoA hydratase/carnithine racemase
MGGVSLKYFHVETDGQGITTVTLDRPPVNAISFDVYPEIKAFCEAIEGEDETRVVILAAKPDARAWCGGADVNDFVAIPDMETRMARYAMMNDCLPRLYNLDRPVIAAVSGPCIGVGFVIASFCDMRVASEEAFFSCPEIDRGVLIASSYLSRVGIPQAKAREMIYVGRRFTARELESTGFLNYVVPRGGVMAKARELAEAIAAKPLRALKANKRHMNESELTTWVESHLTAQTESARLTFSEEGREAARAFLDKRPPAYTESQ